MRTVGITWPSYAKTGRVIVLDARVLIAHFDAEDAQHEDARNVLLSVADEPLRTRPLTQLYAVARQRRFAVLGRRTDIPET